LLIGIIAVAVFLLDWFSKSWVVTHMVPGQSIQVIPGFFSLTFVENAGAAFGLLQRQTLLFIVIALLVIVLILTYGRAASRERPWMATAFGLQLGGAAGNLVDRVFFHGLVVDFIDFHVWPFVFNVADAAIVIGGALFALLLLRDSRTDVGGQG
jgi:signal peptidase II